ncbi:MAG TPA: AarF/UbiB family protein [Bdellovibrionota bacterium]|jgi:ubiquinone biosynthesis protein|nr:AarF/UbiB family protein [Bdellovibrionota bacterium]
MGFSTIQSIWREGLSEIHVRSLGDALVRVLHHAGPFFVKIGQILSTRDDLLPESICQQLARLYEDEAPRMPLRDVYAQLLKNFPDRIPFSEFEEEPIGVGGVAQVHRAKLDDGTQVAVKILRPGIEHTVERDVRAAQTLVQVIFDHLGPKTKEWSHMVQELIEDLGEAFHCEVNLDQEAQNLIEFRTRLEGNKNVFVPAPYLECCTREVLVSDEVVGLPLSKLIQQQALSPELSKKVASLALKEILKQVVEVGIFHPDPHGGNLILMDDERLGMVDLALAARFSAEHKEELIRVLQAIFVRDAEKITRAFLDFAESPDSVDAEVLKAALQAEIDKDLPLGTFAGHVMLVINRFKITLNKETITLVRSLITVEALSKRLDPGFNTAKAAIPTVLFSYLKNKFTK